MKAQEACLLTSTKKGLLPAAQKKCLIASSLSRSKAELVALQEERFRQESRQHEALDDWIIWLFPVNPPTFAHRFVDRLLIGDQKLANRLFALRTEMGV